MKRSCSFDSPAASASYDVDLDTIDSPDAFARWCKFVYEKPLGNARNEGEVRSGLPFLKVHEVTDLEPLPAYAFKFPQMAGFSHLKFREVEQFDDKQKRYTNALERKKAAEVGAAKVQAEMNAYFTGGTTDYETTKRLCVAFLKEDAQLRSPMPTPDEERWLNDMRPVYEAAKSFFGAYLNGPRLLSQHVAASEKVEAKKLWADAHGWEESRYRGRLTKAASVSPGDMRVYSQEQDSGEHCRILLQSLDPSFWWIAVHAGNFAGTYEFRCVSADCLFVRGP
jgi:hypothetical protein